MRVACVLFYLVLSHVMAMDLGMEELSETSLFKILNKAEWIDEKDELSLIPPGLKENETVGYMGNVVPTSLYKQEGHFVYPTLPWIATYNPFVGANPIHAAFVFKTTKASQAFFKDETITTCSLVVQHAYLFGGQAALKLHGFVHGKDAGTINVNSAFRAIVDPVVPGPTIAYWQSGSNDVTESVHAHGGVASPDKAFWLKGIKELLDGSSDGFQGVKVRLPAQRHASLIVLANEFWKNEWSAELTHEAALFFENIMVPKM